MKIGEEFLFPREEPFQWITIDPRVKAFHDGVQMRCHFCVILPQRKILAIFHGLVRRKDV